MRKAIVYGASRKFNMNLATISSAAKLDLYLQGIVAITLMLFRLKYFPNFLVIFLVRSVFLYRKVVSIDILNGNDKYMY